MHGMKKGTHRAGRMPIGAHVRTGETRSRVWQILSDFYEDIKGTPLDGEHPERDFWLVVAFMIVPAYFFWELVMCA